VLVPLTFTNVFDPPSAIKIANAGGWPEVEWKMVWINDGNALAMNVHVEDPLVTDVTFVPGTLNCDARGTSITEATATGCYYDATTRTVIWNGNIASDFGNHTEATAANEVVITFRTTVPANINAVENQGIAYWDQNGDGNVDFNKTVQTDDPATNPNGDITKVSNPIPTPTPTPTPAPTPTPSTGVISGLCETSISPLAIGEILVSFTQAEHGVVVLNNGGTPEDGSDDTFTYIPDEGYSGKDSFTYTVSDKNGNVETKTIHITVPEAISYRGSTIDVTDSGEQLLSFTQPQHGIVTLDDGGTPDDLTDDVLRYVPKAGYSGLDSFTYTIIDNAGDTITKTMTVSVDNKQSSDNGDTLGKFSIMFLMLLGMLTGLYYIREEEMINKKEK
jgi:uncharacterized repeat protein (TIGR01451 family)